MGVCLQRSRSCVSCAVNSIRWVPVLFVVAVVVWAYYAYCFQLAWTAVQSIPLRILYLSIFHILLFFFCWSYYQTLFARLPPPPPQFFLPREALDELNAANDDIEQWNIISRFVAKQRLPIKTKGFDGGIRYCPKCRCIKPDRAHHCSVCSQCVLKFDHHCPWVNTCVSFHNYKFFLLFLGYGCALCAWGSATNLPYFIDFWKNAASSSNVFSAFFHVIFLYFVSTMFAFSLGFLFAYHLWLTAKNRTTLG